MLEKFGAARFGANPVLSTMSKIFDVISMPTLEEMRLIVKKSGRHTLREIEKATIEKLSNKIMK
jgi:hypothetical protein